MQFMVEFRFLGYFHGLRVFVHVCLHLSVLYHSLFLGLILAGFYYFIPLLSKSLVDSRLH